MFDLTSKKVADILYDITSCSFCFSYTSTYFCESGFQSTRDILISFGVGVSIYTLNFGFFILCGGWPETKKTG
jgi:hypothetical protein